MLCQCYCALLLIFLTTQTLTSMVAHIMVTSVNGIVVQEADRQIKICLSCFDKFDQELGESTYEENTGNQLNINNLL